MEKIYSKIQPNKLLHVVHRLTDVINRKSQRADLINEDEFIQCSSLKMPIGTTFKAHKHIWKNGEDNVIAQESWVVIIGSVKCYFYDLDDTLLETVTLFVGDASFTSIPHK